MLNLVCRDEELKADVLHRLKQVFPFVWTHTIEDEVNMIIYAIRDHTIHSDGTTQERVNASCTDSSEALSCFKMTCRERCLLMNKHLYKQNCDKDEVDLAEQVEKLSIT